VSLGTVPDFTYQGNGVRIDGTVPGSPAEAAGLTAGDVVLRLGNHETGSLRALSSALKEFEPGTTVTLVYLRDGTEHEVPVTLEAR
jgi:S1-C subfamily serine protease